MTTAPLDHRKIRVAPLSDPQALANFESGERDIDRGAVKCCEVLSTTRLKTFCAHYDNDSSACGFYALSMSAAETKYLGKSLADDADGRSYLPFIYLNYLGVRTELQNNKIGSLMLVDALKRAAIVGENVGVFGVALNALNDRVAGMYDRYGFRAHGDRKQPLMILPMQSVFDLFRRQAPSHAADERPA